MIRKLLGVFVIDNDRKYKVLTFVAAYALGEWVKATADRVRDNWERLARLEVSDSNVVRLRAELYGTDPEHPGLFPPAVVRGRLSELDEQLRGGRCEPVEYAVRDDVPNYRGDAEESAADPRPVDGAPATVIGPSAPA